MSDKKREAEAPEEEDVTMFHSENKLRVNCWNCGNLRDVEGPCWKCGKPILEGEE